MGEPATVTLKWHGTAERSNPSEMITSHLLANCSFQLPRLLHLKMKSLAIAVAEFQSTWLPKVNLQTSRNHHNIDLVVLMCMMNSFVNSVISGPRLAVFWPLAVNFVIGLSTFWISSLNFCRFRSSYDDSFFFCHPNAVHLYSPICPDRSSMTSTVFDELWIISAA